MVVSCIWILCLVMLGRLLPIVFPLPIVLEVSLVLFRSGLSGHFFAVLGIAHPFLFVAPVCLSLALFMLVSGLALVVPLLFCFVRG